ncbi:tetratricopeptide repeat protein [Nonomuraea sp. NPDC050451]|uniref:tetratricopeptide repeat protein n=1 Tax=Nonomuraea sp. NPDC050451 TaxID=3364364 RepID=UPI00379C0F52
MAEVRCREQTCRVDPAALAYPVRHGVRWLEAESLTVSRLVRQTLALGLSDECWAIAVTGCWLSAVQSSPAEYRTLLTTAAEAAKRSGDRRAEALSATLLGDFDLADAAYDAAERVFTSLDETRGLVELWKARATMELVRGDHAGATRRYLWIRDAAPQVGDDHAEAMALRGLGRIQLAEGRPGQGLPYLDEAMDVASRGRNAWQRLTVLVWLGLGQVATDRGDHGEADAHLTRAAERAERCGEKHVLSRIRPASRPGAPAPGRGRRGSRYQSPR